MAASSLGSSIAFFSALFLLTAAQTNVTTASPAFACGNTPDLNRLSRRLIQTDCGRHLEAFNTCCVGHDNCYENQGGRGQCDKNFCRCVRTIPIKNPKCRMDADVFCVAVQWFGQPSYLNAARRRRRRTLGIVAPGLHKNRSKRRRQGRQGRRRLWE